MLVLHRAIKVEDGKYIKGFVSWMDGQYYIAAEDKPSIGVLPCIFRIRMEYSG